MNPTTFSIPDAIARLDRAATLKDNGRHLNYTRVCTLASEYSALATGQNFDQFLVMFNRREDPDQFAQRVAITVPKTSSLLAPAITQFQRTSRLQNIRRDLTYDAKSDSPILKKVRESMNNFYAEGGVDEWIATIYDWVSLIDPNSYAVVEFDKSDTGQIMPYPIVYFSNMVYETGRNNRKQLQYLLAQPDSTKPDEYILYAGDFTFRYTILPEVEGGGLATVPPDATDVYTVAPIFQATDVAGKPVGRAYLRQYYQTKCPFVQAERMGYLPDPVTLFETCVSALEPSKYVLIDHVRTGSNFDLTKYLHVMPQKVIASRPCSNDGCNKGDMPDGSKCGKCEGTGIAKVHSQPTDTIEVPMDPRHMESMPDLTKLIQYVNVELGTFDALSKNLDALANSVYVSIFNNQSIQQTQVTAVETATKFAAQKDNENNTLAPFFDHKASIYRFAVRCQAVFVSDTTFDIKKFGVVYEGPKDLKPLSLPEIYAYLQAAIAADAPPFEIEQIVKDLLQQRYEGDPDGLLRAQVRASHLPFMGLTTAQIEGRNASGLIRKRDMVLLTYQDCVFSDLERDNEGFYTLKYKEQDTLITKYVDDLIKELPESILPTLNMGRTIPMPISQQPTGIGATA